ncbi:MAG: adenylate/guanylate cyclase domain-containing protein [Myxococcales bacterium]
MNYDGLTEGYWTNQRVRIERLHQKIVAREGSSAGRVVPDDEDLAIGDGRRLMLAVLFLDISGFSDRRSATMEDQELMRRALNLFFTEMMKIAEDYGATVEKNTGDGLMAYFETTGDQAAGKRALTCAMTMMVTNDFLISPIMRASGVTPFEFRISIDYGLVTVARLGAARRFNAIVAIGATANFASKMLAKANPGDIVLGAEAARQIPEAWQRLHVEIAAAETGWIYVATGEPYLLYRYVGRWSRLT